MRDFVYHNPTKILFGKGQIQSLEREVPREARVLLLTGSGSIRNNGVHEQVRKALLGHQVWEFWGIESNPDVETALRALALVREEQIDFLLAVGGGSVADLTKFVAGLACTPGDALLQLSKGGRFTEALPVGVVMTAPGTGSESNSTGAISSRATSQKLIFSSPLCFPRFAILDPETTYSLPPRQVANGIVDAFVHVIEQYLTFPAGGFLQDRLAEAILLTLLEHGPAAIQKPNDYATRANVMWAATLALNGLIGQGVPQDWTTHHFGHELTALFGIDHARTLAAVLPAVMAARRQQKAEKLLRYGALVLGVTEGSEDERIDSTIQKTVEFFESLGVPTRLSAYELGPDAVPKVVANLKASRRLRMGERLDINLDEAARILTRAL